MKIIIAGGRDFDNYAHLKQKCAHILQHQDDIEIVCGGAKGADSLGAVFATEKHYPIKYFIADWARFGRSAGYKRNEEMAKYADCLIAFWDDKSRGTKHMIDLANKHSLNVRVCAYN